MFVRQDTLGAYLVKPFDLPGEAMGEPSESHTPEERREESDADLAIRLKELERRHRELAAEIKTASIAEADARTRCKASATAPVAASLPPGRALNLTQRTPPARSSRPSPVLPLGLSTLPCPPISRLSALDSLLSTLFSPTRSQTVGAHPQLAAASLLETRKASDAARALEHDRSRGELENGCSPVTQSGPKVFCPYSAVFYGTVAVFYVVSRAKDRYSRCSPVAELFSCIMGTAAPLGQLDLRESQHGHRPLWNAFKSVCHGKPTRGLRGSCQTPASKEGDFLTKKITVIAGQVAGSGGAPQEILHS